MAGLHQGDPEGLPLLCPFVIKYHYLELKARRNNSQLILGKHKLLIIYPVWPQGCIFGSMLRQRNIFHEIGETLHKDPALCIFFLTYSEWTNEAYISYP